MDPLREQIEPFVREELGCRCPDEVFCDIRVVEKPTAFEGLPVHYSLEIGGRLLVVVCLPDRWCEVSRQLRDLVHKGLRVRDRGGFNRLRLIVPATDRGAACQELETRFSSLASADQRVHLHVVGPAALPTIPVSNIGVTGG